MNDNFNNIEDEINETENVSESEYGSDIEDEFLFSETSVDESIKINKSEDENVKRNRMGLTVFCVILAFAIVLSCCVTGAYFIGKNSFKDNPLLSKPSSDQAVASSSVYAQIKPSIVGIYAYNNKGVSYHISGLVYSEDGYIVTTDSVYTVVEAAKFLVMTDDGKSYPASFVAGDQRSNISVIKINESVSLTPVKLGNSDQIVVGEKVYGIGKSNNYDKPAVLSEGIVNSPIVRVTNSVTSHSTKVIQTSVSPNPGDFGGALVNEYGQVIGMLSSKVISSGYEKISYSVPSAEVKNIVDQIIKNGKVSDRARLGISYYYKNSADAMVEGLIASGILIADVDKESELYDKLKADDIVTAVNGVNITNEDVILDAIDAAKPGDKITLTVVSQDGSKTDYTATLLGYESTSSYTEFISDSSPENSEGGKLEGF